MKTKHTEKKPVLKHAKGKKAEVAQHKPLKGRRIYLDLRGYRGCDVFEDNIKLLGATLEKCFSKDVQILITNQGCRKDYERAKSKGAGPSSAPSPATPSPFNITSVKALDSPQPDSPSDVNNKAITRARAIVMKAQTTKNYGSTNLVQNARKWGIKIAHIEQAANYVQKEIEKVPKAAKVEAQAKKDADAKPKHKVRRLKGSYLKFESVTHHYRPVIQPLPTFPQLTLASPVGTCPFDPPKKGEAPIQDLERAEREERDKHGEEEEDNDGLRELERGGTGDDDASKAGDGSKVKLPEDDSKKPRQRHPSKKEGQATGSSYEPPKLFTKGELKRIMMEKIRADQKRGYCEACEVKYEDIDKHVRSEQHKSFARNTENYLSLDAMINQGPNMEQFLEDVIKYQDIHKGESNIDDEVLLLPEMSDPHSHRKTRARTPLKAKQHIPKSPAKRITSVRTPVKNKLADAKTSSKAATSKTPIKTKQKSLQFDEEKPIPQSPPRKAEDSVPKSPRKKLEYPGAEQRVTRESSKVSLDTSVETKTLAKSPKKTMPPQITPKSPSKSTASSQTTNASTSVTKSPAKTPKKSLSVPVVTVKSPQKCAGAEVQNSSVTDQTVSTPKRKPHKDQMRNELKHLLESSLVVESPRERKAVQILGVQAPTPKDSCQRSTSSTQSNRNKGTASRIQADSRKRANSENKSQAFESDTLKKSQENLDPSELKNTCQNDVLRSGTVENHEGNSLGKAKSTVVTSRRVTRRHNSVDSVNSTASRNSGTESESLNTRSSRRNQTNPNNEISLGSKSNSLERAKGHALGKPNSQERRMDKTKNTQNSTMNLESKSPETGVAKRLTKASSPKSGVPPFLRNPRRSSLSPWQRKSPRMMGNKSLRILLSPLTNKKIEKLRRSTRRNLHKENSYSEGHFSVKDNHVDINACDNSKTKATMEEITDPISKSNFPTEKGQIEFDATLKSMTEKVQAESLENDDHAKPAEFESTFESENNPAPPTTDKSNAPMTPVKPCLKEHGVRSPYKKVQFANKSSPNEIQSSSKVLLDVITNHVVNEQSEEISICRKVRVRKNSKRTRNQGSANSSQNQSTDANKDSNQKLCLTVNSNKSLCSPKKNHQTQATRSSPRKLQTKTYSDGTKKSSSYRVKVGSPWRIASNRSISVLLESDGEQEDTIDHDFEGFPAESLESRSELPSDMSFEEVDISDVDGDLSEKEWVINDGHDTDDDQQIDIIEERQHVVHSDVGGMIGEPNPQLPNRDEYDSVPPSDNSSDDIADDSPIILPPIRRLITPTKCNVSEASSPIKIPVIANYSPCKSSEGDAWASQIDSFLHQISGHSSFHQKQLKPQGNSVLNLFKKQCSPRKSSPAKSSTRKPFQALEQWIPNGEVETLWLTSPKKRKSSQHSNDKSVEPKTGGNKLISIGGPRHSSTPYKPNGLTTDTDENLENRSTREALEEKSSHGKPSTDKIVKKQYDSMDSMTNWDSKDLRGVHSVDDEIEFNFSSPQKQRRSLSGSRGDKSSETSKARRSLRLPGSSCLSPQKNSTSADVPKDISLDETETKTPPSKKQTFKSRYLNQSASSISRQTTPKHKISEKTESLLETPKSARWSVLHSQTVSSPDIDTKNHVVPRISSAQRINMIGQTQRKNTRVNTSRHGRKTKPSPKGKLHRKASPAQSPDKQHKVPRITPTKKKDLLTKKSAKTVLDNSKHESPVASPSQKSKTRKRKHSDSCLESPKNKKLFSSKLLEKSSRSPRRKRSSNGQFSDQVAKKSKIDPYEYID